MNRKLMFVLCVTMVTGLMFTSLAFAQTKIVFQTIVRGDFPEIISRFEKENPDIKVEFRLVPYNVHLEQLLTSFAAGDGPDVCYINSPWASPLISRGYIEPITDFIRANIDTASYHEPSWEAFTVNGEIYALPVRVGIEAMYYNKEMLKEGGFDSPPKTWDEYLEWAKAVGNPAKRKYAYGMTAQAPMSLSYRYLCWLLSAGGNIADEHYTTGLMNTEEAIASLDFETSLYTKHNACPPTAITDNINDVYLMLVQGMVGSMLRPPCDMLDMYRDHNDFFNEKLVIGPMPSFDGKKPGTTVFFTYGLARKSNTKNPEACNKLIEFFSRPENMAKITMGDIPADEKALDYPGPEVADGVSIPYNHEHYQGFLRQAPFAKTMPIHPLWPQIEEAIWEGYHEILQKGLEVEVAAKKINDKINQILKQKH
jgi:multiple sugar transport system substrate-binding protein